MPANQGKGAKRQDLSGHYLSCMRRAALYGTPLEAVLCIQRLLILTYEEAPDGLGMVGILNLRKSRVNGESSLLMLARGRT